MMNDNTMDLVANAFIRDFQAARRNLVTNGNANVGESTGNLGRLYGGTIPSSVFGDIQNNNVGVLADALDRRTQGIGLAAASLPDTFFRRSTQFGGRHELLVSIPLRRPATRRGHERPAFAAAALAYSRDDVLQTRGGHGDGRPVRPESART
jgi:hypothetical protein